VDIINSAAKSRCRRGGQSSVRFSRLRDLAEDHYTSNLAETIHGANLTKPGIIVIGGPADIKRQVASKLLETRIILIDIELPPGPVRGGAIFRELQDASKHAVSVHLNSVLVRKIKCFTDELTVGKKAIYGLQHIDKVLEYGVLAELFVPEDMYPELVARAKEAGILTTVVPVFLVDRIFNGPAGILRYALSDIDLDEA
jgi:peptide subunit release factor 1 (eRF1)